MLEQEEEEGYSPERSHEEHQELVRKIDELCEEAFKSPHLSAEDIYLALERVKWIWLSSHVEARLEERLEKFGIELKELEE